jgi:3-oxoacyl-[acyl-carrier protein] reductase
MDFGLKGKVAVVTGSGSQIGFGKGIALVLAGEGCEVIVADKDFEGAQKTATEINGVGNKAVAVKMDVTNGTEVDSVIKKVLDKFGKIDILVNDAGGIAPFKLFKDKTEADWDRDINLNLKGTMNCIRAVVNQMIARKSGKIINISSIGVRKALPNTSVYDAAKAGIVALTQVLAVELAPLGITVNAIAPGMGLTGFAGGAPPPGLIEDAKARIPNRRTTTPQDIGNMVAFLASDVSSDIVGQNIGVDGGESIT